MRGKRTASNDPRLSDPLDIAWLAGLLEGEGCFRLHHNGAGLLYANIALRMTDGDVVERAAHLMGARVHLLDSPSRRNTGRKPIYSAAIYGVSAEIVMRAVIPYMGDRRRAKIADVLNHDVPLATCGNQGCENSFRALNARRYCSRRCGQQARRAT